jgi:ATP-dependent Clp protease ATP-binding subunit ClpC
MLKTAGITYDRAKTVLNLTPKTLLTNTSSKGLSATAKLTIKMSWQIAQEFDQEYTGTEHILFSLLAQKDSRASKLLHDMDINMNELRGEIEDYLNSQQSNFGDGATIKISRRQRKGGSILSYFGTNLTEQAAENELDPLIGRDKQLKRMVTILSRRTKNNPVLIGEPGVGKTAIVEGLAQRIVSDDVPESLIDTRLITLDLAGMIAGTKYRGEFEERLKRVMKELDGGPETILFIDEMHLLVGAGAAEGAIDAGNILKPALARGNIRVIGATTIDEYNKYIETDAALERRFQSVLVPEATKPEALAILRGLKKYYEEFHGVSIADEVIDEAVMLSKRYVADRFLPDKAIDLIDEAAAHARIERGKVPEEQRKLQRSIKLASVRLDQAVEDEDFERAQIHKTRLTQLNDKLESARAERNKKSGVTLKSEDIAEIISTMTGVPLTKVLRTEAKDLLNLESELKKHVVGQTEAVKAVSKAIRRNRSGISAPNRPIGSFIFLGPSGVGKTELARAITKIMYDREDALIKIDMSEFSEKHTVARLVGAPAGYVGYGEGGQLTEKVRRNPYSLVLFDEIEKAHPEVFNMLLQILEDGQLTDAKGRSVDFSNTIVIMTSNIGAQQLKKEASLGFRVTSDDEQEELEQVHQATTQKVLDDLKSSMRPELLNRIDKTIVFRALTKDDIENILDIQLKEFEQRLGEQKIGFEITRAGKQRLIENGYDGKEGARPLRRAIQDMLEDPIAVKLLESEISEGDVVKVGSNNKELYIEKVVE